MIQHAFLRTLIAIILSGGMSQVPFALGAEPNQTPAANADSAAIAHDHSGRTTVLANDTGLGDQPVRVKVVTAPLYGETVVNVDKTITYKPAAGYVGSDSYVYRVIDADRDSSEATVTLVVGATASPIGTWELTLSGGRTGLAYLTFSEDFSLTGYAITSKTFELVQYEGTWSIDETGQVVASFLQDSESAHSLTAVISGESFTGDVVVGAKSFHVRGRPATSVPNARGDWTTDYTVPAGFHYTETYQIRRLRGFPGAFGINLSGFNHNVGLTYTGEGTLLLSQKSQGYIFVRIIDGSFTRAEGRVNVAAGTAVFTGSNSHPGHSLSITLHRQ